MINFSFELQEFNEAITPYGTIETKSPGLSNIVINDFTSGQHFRTGPDNITNALQLELENRLLTIVLDESGSMTWNDIKGDRYTYFIRLLTKLRDTYPGNIVANLLGFGGVPVVSKLLVSQAAGDFINSDQGQNLNQLLQDVFQDSVFDFSGIRVIRRSDRAPTHPADGIVVAEGIFDAVKDDALTDNVKYYYGIWTFNKDKHFSTGKFISGIPRDRILPTGVNFATATPKILSGVVRDSSSQIIYNFTEGSGFTVFDSSGNGRHGILGSEVIEDNFWLGDGTSGSFEQNGELKKSVGVRFDGILDILETEANDDFAFIANSTVQKDLTVNFWVYRYPNSMEQWVIGTSNNSSNNIGWAIGLSPNGEVLLTIDKSIASGFDNVILYNNIPLETWTMITVVLTAGVSGYNKTIYINGETIVDEWVPEISDTSGQEKLYIGAKPVDSSNIWEGTDFFGLLNNISIHNISRNSLWVLDTYNQESIIFNQALQISSESPQDNSQREVLLSWDISKDFDFQGGQVKILRKYRSVPEHDSDGDLVLIQNASSGQFFYVDTFDFVNNADYYYRIFTINALGNVCDRSDARVLPIHIPATPDNIVANLPDPVSNVTIINGNRKVLLQWINPSNAEWKGTKIFFGATNFPTISNASQGTLQVTDGFEIFDSQNTSIQTFVHRKLGINDNGVAIPLVNGTFNYYTIVTYNRLGRLSEAEFIIGTPLESLATVFPPAEVEDLHITTVNPKTLSIQWKSPLVKADNLDLFFGESALLFVSIKDIFGGKLDDLVNIKLQICTEITDRDLTTKEKSLGILNSGNTLSNACGGDVPTLINGGCNHGARFDENCNNEREDAETVVSFSTVESGLIKGILTHTSNTSILTRREKYEMSVRAKYKVEDPDTKQLLFEFNTEPVVVSFRHPLNISIVNHDNRFVTIPCGSNQTIRGQTICSNNNNINENSTCNSQQENGTYINATKPYLARVELQFKGTSLPTGTPINVELFKKTLEQPLTEKPQFVTIREGLYNSVAIQESQLDANGNETGDIINKSIVDVEIKAPSSSETIDLYVSINYLGFFVDAVHSVKFLDSLFIQVESNEPIVNGIDVAEQFATLWTIDPDDPTNINAKIPVPDGTLVKWELIKLRHAKNRPFFSTETINELVSGIYSNTIDGVARNVFFGPISNIQSHHETLDNNIPCCIGEEYAIKASVILNNKTAVDQVYITFPCTEDSQISLNKKFFMNAADNQPGQAPNYIGWADGESLLKFQIAKNSALILDNQIPGASCFRNCVDANFGGQLITFPEGHIVQITAPGEILWNVVFEKTIGTGDTGGQVIENNIISANSIAPAEGDKTVTAGIPIVGDVTDFYVRLNKFVGDKFNPQPENCNNNPGGGIGNAGQVILSCEWENHCKDIVNCSSTRGIRWTGVSPIFGSSTFISDNLSITLSGGGGYESGNPPILIGFKEPLDVNIIEARINGQRLNTQELVVDGISQHTIVVEIKFANKPVPDGTEVELFIDGADASVITLSNCSTENVQPGCNPAINGIIFTKQVNDPFINPIGNKRSFAYFTINPLPNIAFNAHINITCRYDKIGTAIREITRCVEINNTINVDTPDPELPPNTKTLSTSVASNEAIMYDTITDIYSTVVGATINRIGHFSASISSGTTAVLYIFGGYTDRDITGGSGITATSESFDIAGISWNLITDMPTARTNGMTVVVGVNIYCIGGLELNPITQQYVVSRKIESFNTINNTWNPSLSSMPANLGVAFGDAQYDEIDNIYVLCGLTKIINNNQPDTLNTKILRYTISSDVWTIIDVDDEDNYKRISPFGFFRSNPIPYGEEVKKMGYIYGGSIPKTLAEINAEFNKEQNQALDNFRSFILTSAYYLSLTSTEQSEFIEEEEQKINESIFVNPFVYPSSGFKYKMGSESLKNGILTITISDRVNNEWTILPKPRDRGQTIYISSQDTVYFMGGANQNKSTTLNRVESINLSNELNIYSQLTSFSRGRSLFSANAIESDIYFSGGLTSGHQNGYVQMELIQEPKLVEAKGTQSSGIIITLRDDAGELIKQDVRCVVRGRLRIPEIDDVLTSFLAQRGADRALGGDGSGNAVLPSAGETVDFATIIKAQNKIIDPNSDQFQFNAAKKLNEQLFLFPVLYSQQEIVIKNGVGAVTLMPRSEDPLANFQRLAQFINKTLTGTPDDPNEKFQGDLTRDELAALGDVLQTITLPPTILDSNTVRNLYNIETTVTIIDDVFFGQTVSDFDENIQQKINTRIESLLLPENETSQNISGNVSSNIAFSGVPVSDSDCFLLQHISEPEIPSADRPPPTNQQNKGPAGTGGISQSGQCLFCKSLIPLKPAIKLQLPTSVTTFFNTNDWVPQIKKRLVSGHTIDDVLTEIDIIDHETPFGASQLYTAIKESATVASGDTFKDRKKSFYIGSDNSENFSLITRNQAIDEINAVDGKAKAPVIYTIFSTSFPTTLSSQLEKTEVGDVEKITKLTGGQSSILVSTGFLDQILNQTIGGATGGLGWGNYKNIISFDELSAITSVTTNFILPVNTQGFLRFRYSKDGFNFTDYTELFKGSQTIDFADFFARIVEFEVILTTGFSESITPEYDSTATGIPQLSNIIWETSGEKEDFIFLNPETVLTNAQQISASFEGTIPSSSIVEIGVASSNSHDWRDFHSNARPALNEFGKTFILKRTDDLTSLVSTELLSSRDGLLYTTIYGAWDPTSTAKLFKVHKDGSITQILSGFRLHPREGQVYFNTRQPFDTVFKLAIINSDKIKIGLRLRNRLHTENIIIKGIGYLYNTNNVKPIELSQVAPSVRNVHISPRNPDSNDIIFGLYDYRDLNADKELGTIIKWFKNGTQMFELNDKTNWQNSDLQISNRLVPGDKMSFSVTPSDGRDFGTTVFSPSVSIVPIAPTVENLSIIPIRNNIINARFDTSSTYKIEYMFETEDAGQESGTEIKWFVNGSLFKKGTFTNGDEVTNTDPRQLKPSETGLESGVNQGISAHVIGNEIMVEITPKTNLITGNKSTSEPFSVVNSIPIITNVNITPVSPTVNSTLQLTYNIDDPDINSSIESQNDQSEIKWLVSTDDGVNFVETELASQVAGLKNVAPFFLSVGEKWKAQVTGFDGLDLGNSIESNVVIISPS